MAQLVVPGRELCIVYVKDADTDTVFAAGGKSTRSVNLSVNRGFSSIQIKVHEGNQTIIRKPTHSA